MCIFLSIVGAAEGLLRSDIGHGEDRIRDDCACIYSNTTHACPWYNGGRTRRFLYRDRVELRKQKHSRGTLFQSDFEISEQRSLFFLLIGFFFSSLISFYIFHWYIFYIPIIRLMLHNTRTYKIYLFPEGIE